jgi:hypothetical protein
MIGVIAGLLLLVRVAMSQQYTFTEGAMTWYQARDDCIAQGRGLVKIASQADNDAVTTFSLGAGSDVWIGLNDLAEQGQYVWVADGSPLGEFDNWFPGEPNHDRGTEFCAEFRYSNRNWNDETCTSSRTGVCELQVTIK